MKIRAANPAPVDGYEDLIISGNRCGNLYDSDVPLRVELCCPHFFFSAAMRMNGVECLPREET
jgi:hypothetical protein